MTIYLDVVFLENICMNAIILYATAIVTKTKGNILRIFLSSAIGALYAVGAYLTTSYIYLNLGSKIILSATMVYVAFFPQNVKLLFKEVIIFYLTSFVFGGCAFFLLYYVKPQEILYKNGLLIGTYPIKIAFLGAIVGFVILKVAFKVIKNRLSKNDMFCDVYINFMGKHLKVCAMIDTGNLLREPITQMPVIVAQKEEMINLIDGEILDNLEEILQGNKANEKMAPEYMARFRLVPFSSLGKQNGMLIGFKPDDVIVSFDRK